MSAIVRIIALTGAIVPSSATAQAPAPLPREIANWLAEQRTDCVSAGGRFASSPRFYTTGDFNGDRRPDYIVSRSQLRCSLGVTWGLDGQVPAYEFFVSSGPRYVLAGYERALSLRVVRVGARDVVEVVSGGPGASSRPQRALLAWNGARMVRMASGQQASRPLPTAPSGGAPAMSGIGPLNMIAGNYVNVAEPCSRPTVVFHYDGRNVGQASRGERWREPVGRVDREQGGLFLFDHGILIKRIGPDRIQRTVQDTGPVERLCPRNEIPASLRL